MAVVREAASASEAELGTLLRREGLHEADLKRFQDEVFAAAARGFLATSAPERVSRRDKKRLRKLEKELERKDKALAEAAALLVLQKKVQALFQSEEEGDDTTED